MKSRQVYTTWTYYTTWDRTVIEVKEGIDRRAIPFFKRENHGNDFIMYPVEIPFSELESLKGKKTKITIEVLE